jgi:hypothetical protein
MLKENIKKFFSISQLKFFQIKNYLIQQPKENIGIFLGASGVFLSFVGLLYTRYLNQEQ